MKSSADQDHEKIINNRIRWLSEKFLWFSPSQHGFRQHRSTTTALSTFVSDIENGFNAHLPTVCILLDIKGAFDNAWHPAVINSLVKKGCPGYLVKLIDSFLKDRTAHMNIQGYDYQRKISKGCPQGSPLSPTLWNLVIDDCLRLQFPENVKISAFADDIKLHCTEKHPLIATIKIQRACESIIEWCKSRMLSLSVEKSEMIIFSRSHIQPYDVKITLNGHSISPQETVNYLGLTFHRKLNWKPQIDKKCVKARKAIGQIKWFTRTNWGCNSRILRKLYSSVIEPILLYGCPIWAKSVQLQWAKTQLRSVQRLMLLAILKCHRTTSTSTLLAMANITPVDHRAIHLATMHFFKHRDLGQSLFHKNTHVKFAFECAPQAGVPLNLCDYPSVGLPVVQPPWKSHPAEIHFDFTSPPTTAPVNESTMHIFTDGSKSNGKTGYSVIAIGHHDTIKISRQRISNFASAFEAEALALNEALKLSKQLSETYSVVKIYTDSKSSLQSLLNERRTSSFLAENQILAHQLGKNISLNLHWVPGHRNIEGNEWADRMAKSSTTMNDNCVRHIKISQNLFKSKINDWLFRSWESEWLSATTNSAIRTFFPSLSSFKLLRNTPLVKSFN
jgi:ribonuclease HI